MAGSVGDACADAAVAACCRCGWRMFLRLRVGELARVLRRRSGVAPELGNHRPPLRSPSAAGAAGASAMSNARASPSAGRRRPCRSADRRHDRARTCATRLTFVGLARECTVVAGDMVDEGRGGGARYPRTAGAPGPVEVPLRFAIVQEGPSRRPSSTKFMRFPVDDRRRSDQRRRSRDVEDDLSFPMPRAESSAPTSSMSASTEAGGAGPRKQSGAKQSRGSTGDVRRKSRSEQIDRNAGLTAGLPAAQRDDRALELRACRQ